jgi:hypothetical protein
VETGVQKIFKYLKLLDSRACPGPDPKFAGMMEKGVFTHLTRPPKFICLKSLLFRKLPSPYVQFIPLEGLI